MGQGNHIKIVWGTTEVPSTWQNLQDEGDWRENPRSRYESKNPWCGYTVAADNGVAGGDELDLERFAVPLDQLAEYIEAKAPKALVRAKERWDAWRSKHPEFPEGRLLFVAEYD